MDTLRPLIHEVMNIEFRQIKQLALLGCMATDEYTRDVIASMIMEEAGEVKFWNTIDAAYRCIPLPGVAPCPGMPAGGTLFPGMPTGGATCPGMPAGGTPFPGMPTGGATCPGMPVGGTPFPGMPTGGATCPGMPVGGTPFPGMPGSSGGIGYFSEHAKKEEEK
ncbi:MAG: hypothetical protein A4E55_02338 [Pelotomaculum sp. PtaU1.Bin035]|nr:MAG: hypothetical protein A4E55_02338 [Pelotomaculum sp. PtaU1.Bin035]